MLLNNTLSQTISEGMIIAVTGYVIVFLALVLLFYVFSNLSKALHYQTKRKLAKQGKLQAHYEEPNYISGEEAAAIAMAIYLYRDLHDDESDVLTIKKISKTYSPWNSRIYGMRHFNRN